MPPVIACTTRTEALFHRLQADGVTPDTSQLLGVPVEAWDDQGAPLVAGRDRLVPVTSFRSNRFVFVRLVAPFTASAARAEEPRRWPAADPDEPRVHDP